jgi:hypothetical protein
MNTYPIIENRQRNRDEKFSVRDNANHSLFMIYTSQIMRFRDAIEIAKDTFSQEQIWPDQCDYIIYKMTPLKKTANNLTNSIKKKGGKVLVHNHYPLLVSVCYFTDQLDLLIDFIREYEEVTDQRMARKSKQKLIFTALHSLESSLQDLIKELDRAMVHSKPL